jgi:hypothetical protein
MQSRRRKQKLSRRKSNIIKRKAYFIVGVGCNSSNSKSALMVLEEDIIKLNTVTSVEILCNPSNLRTAFNIVKSILSFHPAKTSKFVIDVTNHIIEKLKDPKTYILLAGHSHGGAVVSRVAEYIQAAGLPASHLRRIRFQTFGSIYICPGDRVSNLNINHIIRLGDIAIKALNIKPDSERTTGYKDTINHITYLDKPDNLSSWQIHNSYYSNILKFYAGRGLKGA